MRFIHPLLNINMSTTKVKKTSDNEFLAKIFDCWKAEIFFYLAPGSQFVPTGPVKILKIGKKLTFFANMNI